MIEVDHIETNKRQFIFVNELANLGVIFEDLQRDKRVTVLNGPCRELNSNLLRFVCRQHCTRFGGKLPFKGLWGVSLKNIKWDKETEYFVMFTSASLVPIRPEYLLELQRNYHVKYVLHMGDHWSSPYSARAREYAEKIHFEYIFTVDDGDVERYGFIKSNAHYSMLVDSAPVSTDYDLYFIGQDKGRLEKLHGIYEYISSGGVSARYRIRCVGKPDKKYPGILYYYRVISYRDSLEEMKHCNCILEVLTKGMAGATLRYNEAICYNKKLLTNNKGVLDLPFYNPAYMRVFESPEDIDCDWVKERVLVDYHYDNRFSPTRLIDRIIELECQKNQ